MLWRGNFQSRFLLIFLQLLSGACYFMRTYTEISMRVTHVFLWEGRPNTETLCSVTVLRLTVSFILATGAYDLVINPETEFSY